MASKPKLSVTINPSFKVAVIINAILCIATGITILVLALKQQDPVPKLQEQLFNSCDKIFMLTAGAFIGLLGGRAAKPDSST